MNRHILLKTLIAIIFMTTGFSPLYSQVSLLPEHCLTIDDITVLRDVKVPSRWYYVPRSPELLEKDPGNPVDPRPAFQLMTYQKEVKGKIEEGGTLQFAVSLRISKEDSEKIKRKLKTKRLISSKDFVDLVPLPFRMANAVLYDASGKSAFKAPNMPGLTPPYITGALPFQLKLDQVGSDLYNALIQEKNNGVGVLLQLVFSGVLPARQFKVTVDYEQTFKYLKENRKLQATLGNFLLGADFTLEREKIRDELLNNHCIQIDSINNASIKDNFIDDYLDSILARISSELFEKVEPPASIDTSSQGQENLLANVFFAGNIQVETKMIAYERVAKKKETIDFSNNVTVERKTACGTFIGINKYSEELKGRLVSTMPLNNWASAFLLLPEVSASPEMNLLGVSMTATVVDKQGQKAYDLNDSATWDCDSPASWKNRYGESYYSLKFPLMSLFKKHDNDIEAIKNEYSFKINVIISQKLDLLNNIDINYSTPLFNGDLPLSHPVNLVESVVFDLSLIDFSNEGFKKATIKVFQNGKTYRKTIYAQKSAEKTIAVIVPAVEEENQLKSELSASVILEKKSSREKLIWKYNDKDLRQIDPSLYFIIFETDLESYNN